MKKYGLIEDIKILSKRFAEDDVLALGSQLAYSLLFSFFPFLIFLITVIGFSSLETKDVLASLQNVLPKEAYLLIKKTLSEVLQTKNAKLLSLSLIFTIWTASSGFAAVIRGLNKAYDEEECRSFLKLQIISLIFTVAVVIIIFATFLLLVFGDYADQFIVKRYGNYFATGFIWQGLRFTIIIISLLFVFASLYHFAPCKKVKWLDSMPGALFSTAGWIIASIVFAFYVNNFGQYAVVYGSLGAVIVLLTWLYFTSIIVILGGELNATLTFQREGKEKPKGKHY